jgi:hypothetical protein|nr:MAG TPA: hypothetical protein [Herelleviridae sp.]
MKRQIYIIILLTSAIWFSSCRSIRHIPIETVKHDSIYISKVLHDSIYQRDSIYVDRKGDTVLIYKDRYLYKYKNLVDTMYVIRIDSIQVPFPVERELSWWQSVKVQVGEIAIGIIIGLIIIIALLRRKK